MADLPQQDTIVQYHADGVTANYVVPFYTPLETDGMPNLDVYTQLATATPVPESDIKIWNVDYTYTPNLDPTTGGTLTFLAGHIPPNGYVVTISRDVQASLDVEFANAQTFSGITLDAALDKLLLITQQNKSYALDRNLSYVINSYLPEDVLQANVQIPILAPGYVWMGATGGGVVSVLLNQSGDTSTLRSELASEAPVTNGATLVGYYDSVNNNPTTVAAQLTYLTGSVVAPLPPGMIIDFGGTVAPAGFLACDGTSYPTATYPNLFAAIGYTWGGSGANFNVPNFARRVLMGSGGVGSGIIGNSVGSLGGEEAHTMILNELVPHNHSAGVGNFSTSSALFNTTNGGPNTRPGGEIATTANSTGAGVPFNVIQPSAVVFKCIKT